MKKSGTIEKCGLCKDKFYCQKDRKLGNKLGVFCSKICANRFIAKTKIGIKRPPEVGKKVSLGLMGTKHSKEVRMNMSKAHLGKTKEKSSNWRGGIQFTYRKRNREKVAFWGRMRKYKEKNAIGSHTYIQWQELKQKFDYMCLCCKRFEPEIKLTEDHIIPLSLNGTNDISNIQPLCDSCNSKKHTLSTNYINLWMLLMQ
jgi:5-methylcytosine-specific restriction endonuclease McrA